MNYAVVFPGQGSQSIGMISELLKSNPEIVKDTFTEASDSINLDLLKLAEKGPESEINKTAITQPLMLVSAIAVYRVWQRHTSQLPQALAGHSLGEYTALVAAESLSLQEATQLVQQRGILMQKAVPENVGGVAAILGFSDDTIIQICDNLCDKTIVKAVNFNAPGQVVIAGHKEKVQQAILQCKELGAKRALLLPLSVPVHCELLSPAAEGLQQAIQQCDLKTPTIDIIHNVDGEKRDTISSLKDAMVKQLCSPVRWVNCVNSLSNYNIDTIIECGPGKVLFGLNRRINKNLKHFSLFNKESITTCLSQL